MRNLLTLTLACVLVAGLHIGCDTGVNPGDDAARSTSAEASETLAASKGNKSAKSNKIDICHYQEEEESYSLINISARAENAHRNHGDGQVGDDVPGMPGFTFDDTCVPVEPIACPCWDASELEAVTAENQRRDENSLSCTNLLSYPSGALIENTEFESDIQGGFAAGQVGVFIDIETPVCLTRNPFAIVATSEIEADACIRQIAARCEAIGTPIPERSAASKGSSRTSDTGSIFGSN